MSLLEAWPMEDSWTEERPDFDPWADTTTHDPAIREALDLAGYYDEPATPEALRECFFDYVDAGVWRDMDLEAAREDVENGDITQRDMIMALRRMK